MNENQDTLLREETHLNTPSGDVEAPQEPGLSGLESPETDRVTNDGGAWTEQDYEGLSFPQEVSVRPEIWDEFKNLAREINLSPQNAQRLIDLESRAAQLAGRNGDAARQEILQSWADKTKALFGPGYEKEIDVALRAADAFGGAELRDLLEATGLGNHPVVVKTFNQIGRLMGEDEFIGGAQTRGTDKTFTEALYGVKSN